MNFEKTVENRRAELEEFIKRQLAENPNDTDFWAEFDPTLDVQFSENDDEESENFGKMEFFVYPIVEDERNGGVKTDTSIYVQIFLTDRSAS